VGDPRNHDHTDLRVLEANYGNLIPIHIAIQLISKYAYDTDTQSYIRMLQDVYGNDIPAHVVHKLISGDTLQNYKARARLMQQVTNCVCMDFSCYHYHASLYCSGLPMSLDTIQL